MAHDHLPYKSIDDGAVIKVWYRIAPPRWWQPRKLFSYYVMRKSSRWKCRPLRKNEL